MKVEVETMRQRFSGPRAGRNGLNFMEMFLVTAPIRGRAFVRFLSFLLFCYTYHLFCFSTSMGYGFGFVRWVGV